MKILIAPDKFKGSLSAEEAAAAIAEGLQRSKKDFEFGIHPLADGGDGSVAILANLLDLTEVTLSVNDPLGRAIRTSYYKTEDAAFIELATASGMTLLDPEERNPLLTSTFGSGQMIRHALDQGLTTIYLFLGGSATNDAGLGIAQALGFQFYDREKNEITPQGGNLKDIASWEANEIPDLSQVNFYLIIDVTNPLFGSEGAAQVYAPQKGATPEQVIILDQGLQHIAQLVETHIGKSVADIPGAGAAGGVAAAMIGLFEATMHQGVEAIMQWTDFDSVLEEADLVISGEGKLDEQSLQGKVVDGVIRHCEKFSTPLVLLVGKNALQENLKSPTPPLIKDIMSLAKNETDAMENAAVYLGELAYQYAIENL